MTSQNAAIPASAQTSPDMPDREMLRLEEAATNRTAQAHRATAMLSRDEAPVRVARSCERADAP